VEIEQAIYQRLAGTAALTALVGDRIFPDEADNDSPRPLLVYAVVSTEDIRTLDGVVAWARHSVNIFCEAETFAEVKAVGVAVNECLDKQSFDGVSKCYRADYQTNDGGDSRSEVLQTYTMIQEGE